MTHSKRLKELTLAYYYLIPMERLTVKERVNLQGLKDLHIETRSWDSQNTGTAG
jgi:hypothetical protein